MEDKYCPDCLEQLSVESGCGSVMHFCDKCKKLVSSKKILSKEERDEKKKD